MHNRVAASDCPDAKLRIGEVTDDHVPSCRDVDVGLATNNQPKLHVLSARKLFDEPRPDMTRSSRDEDQFRASDYRHAFGTGGSSSDLRRISSGSCGSVAQLATRAGECVRLPKLIQIPLGTVSSW